MRWGMSPVAAGGVSVERHNICSQMKTACDFDSESGNFANAYKYHLRNILFFFPGYRPFFCLLAAQADADFSICRFVKHHRMFWFSIKNILPKWFPSPMLKNKRVSSLSPSSMCSAVQWLHTAVRRNASDCTILEVSNLLLLWAVSFLRKDSTLSSLEVAGSWSPSWVFRTYG